MVVAAAMSRYITMIVDEKKNRKGKTRQRLETRHRVSSSERGSDLVHLAGQVVDRIPERG